MALFLAAALGGVTGSGGLLAHGRVETPAATFDYPRIARWQAADDLTVTLPPRTSGEVELDLSSDFVRLFSIESVEPTPTEVAATRDGHRFTFDVLAGGGIIAFHVRPSKPSLPRRVTATVGTAPPAHMTITVLP